MISSLSFNNIEEKKEITFDMNKNYLKVTSKCKKYHWVSNDTKINDFSHSYGTYIFSLGLIGEGQLFDSLSIQTAVNSQ